MSTWLNEKNEALLELIQKYTAGTITILEFKHESNALLSSVTLDRCYEQIDPQTGLVIE